jgi:hypothetical protein
MRLDEYQIGFAQYPWLPPVSPFVHWQASAPTKSLSWYAAYNATKHDREGAFDAGALADAVAAVCACAALIVAQYGSPSFLGQRTELSDHFVIRRGPNWALSQVYIHPYSPAGWTPQACPLKASVAARSCRCQ